MKVKVGFKVMKLVKRLIGMEVTVGGPGSECHLTYQRRSLLRFWPEVPPVFICLILLVSLLSNWLKMYKMLCISQINKHYSLFALFYRNHYFVMFGGCLMESCTLLMDNINIIYLWNIHIFLIDCIREWKFGMKIHCYCLNSSGYSMTPFNVIDIGYINFELIWGRLFFLEILPWNILFSKFTLIGYGQEIHMRKYPKAVDFINTKHIIFKITLLLPPKISIANEYEMIWSWKSRSRSISISGHRKLFYELLVIH